MHSTHFVYGYISLGPTQKKTPYFEDFMKLTATYVASISEGVPTHPGTIFKMAARHMVKDHLDCERGNPLLPCGLLFPISSKGSFICTIPQT